MGRPTADTRLHLAIGPECNNHCSFCMEADRAGRRRANAALTPAAVRHILEEGRGAPEVCFTSGEPTLVANLPRFIAWARELGYPRISLATNGRRLAYAPYCVALAKAGLTLFHIAIHGPDARAHDALTRTPGAFAQTRQGLENASQLRRHGVLVHTSTVVTRRNLHRLQELYALLTSIGVDQTVFNVARPSPRFSGDFVRVMPRYTEVVAVFNTVLAGAPGNAPAAYLVDVPPCLLVELPLRARGWTEAYVHHELDEPSRASGARDQPQLILIDQRARDRSLRRKLACCEGCALGPSCDGIWAEYLDHYTAAEFGSSNTAPSTSEVTESTSPLPSSIPT